MEKKLEEINPVLIKMVREIVETQRRKQLWNIIVCYAIGAGIGLLSMVFLSSLGILT